MSIVACTGSYPAAGTGDKLHHLAIPMGRLKLKREVVRLLRYPDLPSIFNGLDKFSRKELVNPLFTCLCHPEETVRWHAVSAFGYVVPAIALDNMEDARIIMRRFLWMLNDESGGIGWGVPEAMGEVMSNHETIAEEYAHMLVSYSLDDGPELFQDGNFLEMPAIQQGLLWGLGRLAAHNRELLLTHRVDSNLDCYFNSPDSQVRGLVCQLCRLLELASFRMAIAGLLQDYHHVRLYQDGGFLDLTVSDLAHQALAGLNALPD